MVRLTTESSHLSYCYAYSALYLLKTKRKAVSATKYHTTHKARSRKKQEADSVAKAKETPKLGMMGTGED